MEKSKWCEVCLRENCTNEGGVHDMENIKPSCYVGNTSPRPSKDEYYLGIADAVLKRRYGA